MLIEVFRTLCTLYAMTQRRRLALLCASSRGQNGAGLTAWAEERLKALQLLGTIDPSIKIFTIDITKPPFPLGPLVDDYLPAGIKNSEEYPSAGVRAWSRLIASLSALIILTPEYNGCYTGELKNCMDHIYNEWRDLPVAIVSYAVYGGKRAGFLLRQALEGVHANVVSQGEVEISLPIEYIAGSKRVGKVEQGEKGDLFLREYEDIVDSVGERLADEALCFDRF